MVLAKEKNNDKALEYLIRSVHLFPMNWGCWLEIASLISRVEDVSPSRAGGGGGAGGRGGGGPQGRTGVGTSPPEVSLRWQGWVGELVVLGGVLRGHDGYGVGTLST